MGFADLVPGISGATVATLTGIYPRIVHALAHPKVSDWRLWLPLCLGVGAAIVVGAPLLAHLLQGPVMGPAIRSLFAVTVLWGVVVCARAARPWKATRYGAALIGGSLGFFALLVSPQLGMGTAATVLVGVIAAVAMVLPGLSGAALLHLCGHYERALVAVGTRDFSVLAPLGLGVVLGAFLFARLADFMMRWAPGITMAFFVGCMLGGVPFLL